MQRTKLDLAAWAMTFMALLFGLANSQTPAWGDESIATTAPKLVDADSLEFRQNDAPALCNELLAQAKRLLRQHQRTCSMPLTNQVIGLEQISWKAISVDEAKAVLSEILPEASFDASQMIRKRMAEKSAANFLEAKHQVWAAYGDNMLAPLRSRPDGVSVADLDVDNDGRTEKVYRFVVPGVTNPAKTVDPSGPWSFKQCDPWSPEPIPYYAIAFEQSETEHFHMFDGEILSLFVFNGKVWSLRPTFDGQVTVYRHRSIGSGPYLAQSCRIAADH
jgi:hypothetical protein